MSISLAMALCARAGGDSFLFGLQDDRLSPLGLAGCATHLSTVLWIKSRG